VSESGDGLGIALPIHAPRAELEGVSESAETRWAARVPGGRGREEFAVCEEQLEVLAAGRREVIQLLRGVVDSDDSLQKRAGFGRAWRREEFGGGGT
jgi:hypothetical protein